ncbi:MAG: hypothetical protein LC634_02520, partial [Sphingomonadales bacterium]|nr:hypothetical protein [Sphingomonadales bacterium]
RGGGGGQGVKRLGGWWRLWIVGTLLFYASLILGYYYSPELSSEPFWYVREGAVYTNDGSEPDLQLKSIPPWVGFPETQSLVSRYLNRPRSNGWRDGNLVEPTYKQLREEIKNLADEDVQNEVLVLSTRPHRTQKLRSLSPILGIPLLLIALTYFGRWVWRGFRSTD